MKDGNNPIGRLFIAGYLFGLLAESFSGKKTKYSSFFATKAALVGTGLYIGSEAISYAKKLLKKER